MQRIDSYIFCQLKNPLLAALSIDANLVFVEINRFFLKFAEFRDTKPGGKEKLDHGNITGGAFELIVGNGVLFLSIKLLIEGV